MKNVGNHLHEEAGLQQYVGWPCRTKGDGADQTDLTQS